MTTTRITLTPTTIAAIDELAASLEQKIHDATNELAIEMIVESFPELSLSPDSPETESAQCEIQDAIINAFLVSLRGNL